jgi:RNA polymerase sigma-70 factor (ECF subfamily)
MATSDHRLNKTFKLGWNTIHSAIDIATEIEHAKHVAFNYIVRRFRMSGDDAEDAIQDACLSLLKTSRPFEGRAKFASYFLSVVINAARMQKRTLNRGVQKRSVCIDFAIGVPSTSNPLQELRAKEQRKWILRKLSRLPPMLREAMFAYYLKERRVAETAKTLGISPSAVKARLKRGRALIRSTMDLSENAIS